MLLALVRRYIRPYRRAVGLVMALQTVSALASLYLPTVNATIVDNGIATGDTGLIARLGLVMLAVTALQGACAVGAVYFGSRAGMGLGRDLRAALFGRVLGFSENETTRFTAPSLLTRTTNDVRQIQTLVQMAATVLVTAPLTCLGGVVMAVRQDTALSWLLALAVPVLVIGNYLIISRMLPVFRSMQRRIDGINRVLREQLSGIRVVRAFSREGFERQRFAQANRELADAALTAGRWQALMLPVSTLTVNLSSVALIWFGGLRIDDGRMQVGSLIAFLSYFMQILMSVLMATLVVVMLPRASVCAERIGEVLCAQPSLTEPSAPRLPPGGITGCVTVDDVTFRYPGAEQPVLEGVSFTAVPGTTTAIVGGTGAGKSALVGLICRLYDVTAGAVRVDGIDVRDYDTDCLWSALGLVPQRGYLFSGTVADNLRYGKPDAGEDEIWAALVGAAADDFVRGHPDGLAMRIAQGGVNLSGGQRQRLAIARAMIRRPPVYLLDDALSALDVHTDATVRSALRETSPEATLIIVSQRISTILDADQIVVLDAGRVVGLGTHAELIDRCPAYAEFVESQMVVAS